MQFYIQQADETTLRPLSSSEIRLSANKYHITAESCFKNGKSIDIRVIYNHPSHQQVFETTTTVAENGKVVILPPTQLRPGKWEIYCRSDLIAEMVGEYWENCLILEVEPAIAPLPMQEPISFAFPVELSEINALIREEVSVHDSNAQDWQEERLNSLDTELILRLDSEHLLRQMGEVIIVSGCIEAKNQYLSHLCYELRRPLSDEVIYREMQPLTFEYSPVDFQYSFTIPKEWEMPLLTLVIQAISFQGDVLTEKTLSIETEVIDYLNYTLELADTDTNTSYVFDIEIEKPIKLPAISVELPKPCHSIQKRPSIRRSSSAILPPKLYPAQPKHSPSKTLVLPQFEKAVKS